MQDRPGGLPGFYGEEIAIMQFMRWDWRSLNEAPAGLVDELRQHMQARAYYQEQKRRIDESRRQAEANRRRR